MSGWLSEPVAAGQRKQKKGITKGYQDTFGVMNVSNFFSKRD